MAESQVTPTPVPVPAPDAAQEQGPWTKFQAPQTNAAPADGQQTTPTDQEIGPWTKFQAPPQPTAPHDEIATPSMQAVPIGEAAAGVAGFGKGVWDLNKLRTNSWKPAEDESVYGVQKYLNKQLKVPDADGVRIPRGTIDLTDLGKATGMNVRMMDEVQAALKKAKGTPGEQVPIEEIIQGVPTITGYKTVGGTPPIDLSPYVKVGALEKNAPALNDFLVKNYKPIESMKNRVVGPAALGVTIGEAQAALNRAREGHTGMASLDAAGAIGAQMAAAKFLPKKLRILGGIAAATAPTAEAVRGGIEGHAAGGTIQNFAGGGLAHLAPGGSVLKKLLPLAEREGNLANFLKDSEVKHPVYHGTGADIHTFDTRKELPLHYTQDETDLLSPLGTHLAKDPAMANNFARKDVEDANVHKLHLNLKNPKVFDSEQKLREEIFSQPSGHYEVDRLFDNPEEYKLTSEEMIHKYDTDPKFRTIVNSDAFHQSLENSWNMGDSEPHVDFITQLTNSWKQANPGIDGVIYKNEAPRELRGVSDPTAYIAFEPTQIKSATGNTGTYNPLDPDITKKRGGLI